MFSQVSVILFRGKGGEVGCGYVLSRVLRGQVLFRGGDGVHPYILSRVEGGTVGTLTK